MKKFILLSAVSLCLNSFNALADSLAWQNAALNSVGFYKTFAYNAKDKTFYSELDNQGELLSKKIYTVALSRLIYALAWTSKFQPDNLTLAINAANFQLKNMLGHDKFGPYFMPMVEGDFRAEPDKLDIWQQAYGMNGLTELYRQTQDSELLKQIHKLHDTFVKRFQDTEHGGFYAEYSLANGQTNHQKSIQSLIYPVSAYMANLWLADINNRQIYQPILQQHMRIALSKPIWNKDTGWINVQFDKHWQVCGKPQINNNDLCFEVTPGHNFQFAWFLLRGASQWRFISVQERKLAQNLAETIINKTLMQPIWPNSFADGFYSAINPSNQQITDKRKTWWQHAEALIALSYVQEQHTHAYTQLNQFFFSHFPDFEYGNEYFYLNEFNKPDTSQAKGSIGKSAYHLTEAVRFLLEAKQ